MSKFTVVADTREKPQYRWHWAESDSCQGTVIEKLDTGDYSVLGLEDVISIDRKATTGELAGNITEKRFPKVLQRLGALPHGFLVCEFSYDDILNFPVGSTIPQFYYNKQGKKIDRWKSLRITPKYLMRYISEIQVNYGVQVILAGNTANAQYVCYNLLRRVWEMQADD